jgi:hypothetical protein
LIAPLPSSQRRYSSTFSGFAFDHRVSEFINDIPSPPGGLNQSQMWQGETSRALRIPYWFVAVVALLAPSIWVYCAARRPRMPGLCPTCGYDLRVTPDRCPECGTVPEKKVVTAE